jgi:hypothetical protein
MFRLTYVYFKIDNCICVSTFHVNIKVMFVWKSYNKAFEKITNERNEVVRILVIHYLPTKRNISLLH